MEREELYRRAEGAAAAGNYARAAEDLAKLYGEDGSLRTNCLLFFSLTKLGEHEQAVLVAEDRLQDYIADNERFGQYLREKVLAGGTIKALQLKRSLDGCMSAVERRHFDAVIEKAYSEFGGDTEKIERKFAHCGGLEPYGQLQACGSAECLDEESYVRAAARACPDPDLHPLVRGGILSELKKLGFSGQMQCFCSLLGKVRSVVPAELPEIEETDAFSGLKERLETDSSIPSDLKERYLGEIRIRLMMVWAEADLLSSSGLDVLYSEFVGKSRSARAEWFERQLEMLGK